MTTTTRDQLATRLAEFGQSHLLAFWDDLDTEQRLSLLAQLEEIDLQTIAGLYKGGLDHHDWHSLAARAKSPTAIRLCDCCKTDFNPLGVSGRSLGESGINSALLGQAESRAVFNAASSALRESKLGVILVAGGQGTRLGFPQPKGMFPIGPISGRSLFQMHIDQVLALRDRFQARIPVYVMTSPATHEATVSYFQSHHFCGMPENELRIFCQGTMPAIDAATGRILLEEKDQLAVSPDGHGGMLAALERSGCLEDIQQRGIEHLFYLQVDNPLVPICDPWTLGNHILRESEMTTLVVAKQSPDEKVGIVVGVDGRLMVIEYSDLPSTAASRRDSGGQLELWAGSTAVHVFAAEFLDRSSRLADALPFHRALKTVPFINDSGERVVPSTPNAIKFERFIFDLMPSARHAIVVEADAERVFAPLKNAAGSATDTPQTTQVAIIRESRRLLESAGIFVNEGIAVEVNPRFAWDASAAAAKLGPGHRVSTPTYYGP